VIVERDGSRVRLRQCHRSDSELLLRGFERLGPDSRYRRFLAPLPALNKRSVRYLTAVDHHDHEAIVALDEHCTEGLGIARYIRSRSRPDVAEAAVTVIDDWQGRGLGTILLRAISARARDEGITAFTASVLANNRRMLDLIDELAPGRIVNHELGTVEIEVPIAAVGVTPALKQLLGIAARHDIGIPPGHGHEAGSAG
jgi:GNAT superfamily N-acetyltransferase